MTDVIVVLDPAFGARLEAITALAPIWIVESDINKETYERLWRNHKHAHHGEKGAITSFGAQSKDDCAKEFLDIMPEVEIHHGRADPTGKELVFPEGFVLKVIGVPLTTEIRSALQESYGFTAFAEAPDGFQATKGKHTSPTKS